MDLSFTLRLWLQYSYKRNPTCCFNLQASSHSPFSNTESFEVEVVDDGDCKKKKAEKVPELLF